MVSELKEEVTLDSGHKIKVRRLLIYELDFNVPKDIPGPYTIEIQMGSGRTYRRFFDMQSPRSQPEKPLEECEEKSPEWYDWQSYLRYQEGLVYYEEQRTAWEKYSLAVAAYILENCIDPQDKEHLIDQDYDKIYKAALCPEVSWEELRAAARNVFWG